MTTKERFCELWPTTVKQGWKLFQVPTSQLQRQTATKPIWNLLSQKQPELLLYQLTPPETHRAGKDRWTGINAAVELKVSDILLGGYDLQLDNVKTNDHVYVSIPHYFEFVVQEMSKM